MDDPLSRLESLPLDLFAQIAERLPPPDILALTGTNRRLHQMCKEVFYISPATHLVRFGTWFGAKSGSGSGPEPEWIRFDNGLLAGMKVKPFTAVSYDFYRVSLILRNDVSDYLTFCRHPYYMYMRHWIRYYFQIRATFSITLRTRLPPPTVFQIRPYEVLTRRTKRDHCNAIGITIGFHTYAPMLDPERFDFHQRVGFHWNTENRVSLWDNDHPLKLNLVSEIIISAYACRPLRSDTGPYWDVETTDSPYYSSVDIIFTATKCYVKAVSPKHFQTMEVFYSLIELYANTVYGLLKHVDYDTVRQEAEVKRRDLSERLFIPPADVILDAPETLEDVWRLLQTMEFHFTYLDT